VLYSGLSLVWQTLALFYYFFAMCAMLVSLAWILSSLGVFWKNIRGIVAILIQFGFWISPFFLGAKPVSGADRVYHVC
jgi:lipopolysaccharide transport system permease protein/teichoic acid transport system permease protein